VKTKDLKKYIDEIPEDADIVISKAFIIDENDALTAILDIPIVGVALNNDNEDGNINEIRFVLSSKDLKGTFLKDEIKFFKNTH